MPPFKNLPLPPDGEPLNLLHGVRVLDLTTSIAAPYATMMLGDLGAEVVKIERPKTGDDARAWGPPFLDEQSLWFLSVNRNKSSVTLDYASDAGRAVLYRLVAAADVVVVNLVKRVQRKLKVDYEALRAIKPDLIFVSLTGFGLTGPNAEKSSYDLIAEGCSGVMDITGEADSPPQKIGTPAADLLAGMDAVIATQAALFDRARTGNGHCIDISMVESMTRFLTPRIVAYLGSGEVPRRTGARDSVIAVYQSFDTADEPMTIGLGNNGIWTRFWSALDQPEVADDPRFSTNAQRQVNRPEITAKIQSILRTRPRDHWLAVLDAAKIPCGPINRVDQVAADQSLIDRGLFYQLECNGSHVPQVGLGIQFDGAARPPRSPPPRLGEHTETVLRQWAQLGDSQLSELRDAGVI